MYRLGALHGMTLEVVRTLIPDIPDQAAQGGFEVNLLPDNKDLTARLEGATTPTVGVRQGVRPRLGANEGCLLGEPI